MFSYFFRILYHTIVVHSQSFFVHMSLGVEEIQDQSGGAVLSLNSSLLWVVTLRDWPNDGSWSMYRSVLVGLRTVSLTDTAVQLMGVDGGGSTSVSLFGSPKQHQTETGGYKTAVNGCRRPSILLTSTKMIYLNGDLFKYEVGCDLRCRKAKLNLLYICTYYHSPQWGWFQFGWMITLVSLCFL